MAINKLDFHKRERYSAESEKAIYSSLLAQFYNQSDY